MSHPLPKVRHRPPVKAQKTHTLEARMGIRPGEPRFRLFPKSPCPPATLQIMPAIPGLCRDPNRARWMETNLAGALSPNIGQFSDPRITGHPEALRELRRAGTNENSAGGRRCSWSMCSEVRQANPSIRRWSFQQSGTSDTRLSLRALSVPGCRPSRMALMISGARKLRRANRARCFGL